MVCLTGAPGGANCQRSGNLCRVPPGARAIAGKLGTPPAATAGATEFVRGALVAVGAYVTIMALVGIVSASLRSLVHSSHTLTWELMTLGPQLALGICLVLGTAFIRSRGPLKNS